MKEERKRIQEANLKKKEVLKEEHKKKSLEGMKRKLQQEQSEVEMEEDDDVDYYRQEVGVNPDEGTSHMKFLFSVCEYELLDFGSVFKL